MEREKFQKWVDKYSAKLKNGKYYSEVYGDFIEVEKVIGFCPVCMEPLLEKDNNYCGYCGAMVKGKIVKEI